MRIKVYQINGDLDSHRTKFISYDSTLKTAGRVDSSIYKTVFDGNLDCSNLEEVFNQLNTDLPPAYQGHSLSVSDVVEVYDSQEGNTDPGFYFARQLGTGETARRIREQRQNSRRSGLSRRRSDRSEVS